jgi:hypothetical protein
MRRCTVTASADTRLSVENIFRETVMPLLASYYDKSRFFKADDLEGERKLRINNATEEVVGAEKEKKLVIWFTNDERGLVSTRPTTVPFAMRLATTRLAGPAK